MRRLLSVCAVLLLCAALAHAAPAVRYRTYFISGVKSADDVAAITAAIKALPSVEEVQGLTR